MANPTHDDELIHHALAAYLDYLEGATPQPPNLDELPDDVRDTAVEVIGLIELLRQMRGVDLNSDTPSIRDLLRGTAYEHLLAGTEFG